MGPWSPLAQAHSAAAACLQPLYVPLCHHRSPRTASTSRPLPTTKRRHVRRWAAVWRKGGRTAGFAVRKCRGIDLCNQLLCWHVTKDALHTTPVQTPPWCMCAPPLCATRATSSVSEGNAAAGRHGRLVCSAMSSCMGHQAFHPAVCFRARLSAAPPGPCRPRCDHCHALRCCAPPDHLQAGRAGAAGAR